MEEKGATKLTGIRQIVRLKELLQKWQSTTISSKESKSSTAPGGIAPAVTQRICNNTHCDSDEDSCQGTHEPPPDVPKGYLAVYVGPELRRFIIPTGYLTHHLFKKCLEKAEEEFGFNHNGGLTIPCEIETFKYLLKCMEKEKQENDVADNNEDKQDLHDDQSGEF